MPHVDITLDESLTKGDMIEENATLEQVVFLEGHTGSGQPAIEILEIGVWRGANASRVFRRKDGTLTTLFGER